MILHAHWKNTFPKKQFGFFITLGDPPPGLVKDHTFPEIFFLNPSLNGYCAHWEEHDPEQMESFVGASSKEGDEA